MPENIKTYVLSSYVSWAYKFEQNWSRQGTSSQHQKSYLDLGFWFSICKTRPLFTNAETWMLFQLILILISSILVSTTRPGKHFLIETEDKEDNVNAKSLHGDDYMVHLKVEYWLKLKFISQVDMCALPIESGGPCWAHFESWGFDKDMKACRKFFYAGCGGNANRFSTKEECMKDCEPGKAEDSHLGY